MKDQNTTKQNINEQPSKASDNTVDNTIDNSYLQSQLLIAMPGLDDPYFKQSVTLICQHNEDGCFGLTINKPIEITIDEVLKQLEIDSDQPVTNAAKTKYTQLSKSASPKSMPALRGGPVQIEQGFVIHDSESKWENTLAISDGLSVTASRDILFDIAAGNGPENYLLTLGCASWMSGQVESEIMDNSWLNCPVDKKIIFNMPFEERWQGAADTLGIDMNAMSGISGHD